MEQLTLWQRIKRLYHQFGSPRYFYQWSARLLPWFGGAALLLLLPGLLWGVFMAPMDAVQGHSYRIIFLHVPAASVALSGYVAMAVAGVITLVWRMKMAEMAVKVIAPIGASFAFLCLVTGAIWGKPTWGTWWVWDARLTSMLVLLFLYLGVMALHNAIDSAQAAARAASVLAIVGVVNLPIIRYSVDWWNTLHQPASIRLTEASMPAEMLVPLLVSIAGAYAYFGVLVLLALRAEILEREKRSAWVRDEVAP